MIEGVDLAALGASWVMLRTFEGDPPGDPWVLVEQYPSSDSDIAVQRDELFKGLETCVVILLDWMPIPPHRTSAQEVHDLLAASLPAAKASHPEHLAALDDGSRLVAAGIEAIYGGSEYESADIAFPDDRLRADDAKVGALLIVTMMMDRRFDLGPPAGAGALFGLVTENMPIG